MTRTCVLVVIVVCFVAFEWWGVLVDRRLEVWARGDRPSSERVSERVR